MNNYKHSGRFECEISLRKTIIHASARKYRARFAFGNYTVEAVAHQVFNETYTTDNTHICDVPVHVGVPGDVTGQIPDIPDKIVDVRDVTYCILLFLSTQSYPNWKSNSNINNDGIVNVREVTIVILNFRRTE